MLIWAKVRLFIQMVRLSTRRMLQMIDFLKLVANSILLDGYIIPLNIQNGLAYMDMNKPTDQEYSSLSHVVLTSDSNWDPTILDSEFDPGLFF